MPLKYLFLALAPFLVSAQKKINLAPVPRAATSADSRSVYTLVKREGALYKRFIAGEGELYVIDSQPLTKETIAAGKCALFRRSSGLEREQRDVEVVVADVKLPESEWRVFGGLIQATIRDYCSETQVALKQLPDVRLGLFKTPEDGPQKAYGIFNTNLRPNLNFGVQF